MSDAPMPSTENHDALSHELRVHQIELKQQNEELQLAQSDLAAAHDRYRDLYDFAPVGYCTLDAQGCIVKINLTGAGLLGQPRAALQGMPLARFVSQNDEGVPTLRVSITDVTDRMRSEVERRIAAIDADARESERRRLALELHEDLGQRLSAMKMHLAALPDEAGPLTASWLNRKLTLNLGLNETPVDPAGRPS